MYKITTQISNANLVLVRKKLGDGSCAALVVMRSPRRYASGDAPKPKSRKLLWGTVGATIITGAAVVYAKNNPEARNWLASNAPWANDFVAFVYQENNKFVTTNLNKSVAFVKNFMFGKEGAPPPEIKPASRQNLEKDAAVEFGKKTYDLPPTKFEPLYVEEPKMDIPEIATKATLIQTEESEPQTPAPVKITKDLVELEHDMHENTKKAIDNYKKATHHCLLYNNNLYRIVESSLPDLDKRSFQLLESAQKERDSAAAAAKEASAKARLALESLDRLIRAGVQAPPGSVTQTQRYIKQFRTDLDAAESGYNAEAAKSIISDRYWNKVEQAREAYKKELQILFPGVDLASRRLDIKGDTDLLLLYTLKQILFLQNELAELQTIRDNKLTRAIECKDDKELIEAKVEDILKKERLNKIREFDLKVLEIQAEAQKKLNEQLKKQYEVQQDVLQDKLKRKEAEIMGNFNRLVNEKMQSERVEFKKELAAMAGKLQAIEQTLKQRANLEAEAKRSQSLWAAAEALLAATRRNAHEAKIESELKALENAGKNDNLVQTVLKGIPLDARENGVVTEKALRLKFEEMEKTAKKVALVGKDGASLPVYFLSWLQSKLLFSSTEIPKDELDNLPTDFTKLDTFDIMQRARYHMDHGNLTDALRYVNLLQGAPRAAAVSWLDAARQHLEIRQAAEAVMAHASVSGLLYL